MAGKTLKDTPRYRAEGVESETEPGSRGRVLRNLLGVRSVREIQARESEALLRATERLAGEVRIDQRFTAEDIRGFHRLWLGEIYAWAGEYRSVNLFREGIAFAAAREVPRLMCELERGPLAAHTPCGPASRDEIARSLAIVHGELVLVHPFRDGNGRLARLVATLMALQAGLPLLDFGNLGGKGRPRYFAAIQAVLDRDYEPLTSLLRATIERSVRPARRSSGG